MTHNNWRPKDWKNPHPKSSCHDFGLGDTTVYGWEHDMYEAGADAMLDALRERPDTLYINLIEREKGWLVLIPDGVVK